MPHRVQTDCVGVEPNRAAGTSYWVPSVTNRFHLKLAKEDDMTMRHHRAIAKILISAAIALGSWVAAATPAVAEPSPAGAGPNPFGTLGCSCRQAPPVDSPAVREEIQRGIQEGLSAWLPGLPPPIQPR